MRVRLFQCLFLAVIAFLSLFLGVASISPLDIFSLDAEKLQMLAISRLPRLCSILVTGSSLSIAGLIMQNITRNRFVSPTTAGTMEWCRLGVMAAIILMPNASTAARIIAAFALSLCGTALFLTIIARIQTRDIVLVPLAGMMLGSVVNAAATFFAYQYDVIQNMTSWLQGNFSLIIQGNYEMLYLSLPLMALAYIYADRFTIAGMGKGMTTALGLNHAHIMRIGLVIVAMICSITIVGVGNIPFLGLVVPNLVSLYKGDSVKNTLFDTAWLGAVLVLVCDVIGRMLLHPYEIPIGIVLSIAGSALFLTLLLRRSRHAG